MTMVLSRGVWALAIAVGVVMATPAPAAEPAGEGPPASAAPSVPVGVPRALDLQMRTVEGRMFRLDDFVQTGRVPALQPRPTVLLFGAHWCVNCKAFAARAREVLGAHAQLVFVHIDDVDLGEGKDDGQIAGFVRELVSILPEGTTILQRGDGGLVQSWGFDKRALPAAALILPDGTVFRSLQHASADEEQVALTSFLGQIAPEGSGTRNHP